MHREVSPAESSPSSAAPTLQTAPPHDATLHDATLHDATLPPRAHRLVEDTVLPYSTGQSYQGQRSGACRLRLFVPEDQCVPQGQATSRSRSHPAIVLVSEQPERAGLSITNGIEAIAAAVCRTYGLDPRHTVLIEHYDDRERGAAARLPGRVNGEKWSCVTFATMQVTEQEPPYYGMGRPQWQRLSKRDVEDLLGCPLP